MNTQQIDSTRPSASRRRLLSAGAGMAGAVAAMSSLSANAAASVTGGSVHTHGTSHHHGGNYLSAKDGTQIFFKDWGTGVPVVFSHGWPLSADAWDAQMLFLVNQGYRVIAHDRRGHGRSGQPSEGNDMNTYADDLAAVLDALDVKGAMLVGHSTGGGEVAHYIGRHGEKRVAKAVLIGAVPPQMVKSANNPNGLPMSVFDNIRAGVAANRSQFYLDLTTPFYGFNRPDAKVSQGLVQDFWRQGMAGSIKGQYECIKQFSEVDYTDDLKKISVPTLILHGDDDQIVPIDDSAKLSAKIVKNATLKVYKGAPHGMCSTHVDQVNADLLEFLKS
ncbi:alpha/beta fold hydrolase [Paraburkholderia sp. JPY419]|uniref:alpha/beta fold hydrolase n=1 Tax=Paraburkholderia sp. JPY419 TaxID=667660 RepID=UPI003D2031D6